MMDFLIETGAWMIAAVMFLVLSAMAYVIHQLKSADRELIELIFPTEKEGKRKNDELDPAEKPKNDDAPSVMLGDDGELFDVIED